MDDDKRVKLGWSGNPLGMERKEPAEDEQEAAQHDQGQEQEPVQADEEKSSSLWDTDEHSDAPGPFGTGDEE